MRHRDLSDISGTVGLHDASGSDVNFSMRIDEDGNIVSNDSSLTFTPVYNNLGDFFTPVTAEAITGFNETAVCFKVENPKSELYFSDECGLKGTEYMASGVPIKLFQPKVFSEYHGLIKPESSNYTNAETVSSQLYYQRDTGNLDIVEVSPYGQGFHSIGYGGDTETVGGETLVYTITDHLGNTITLDSNNKFNASDNTKYTIKVKATKPGYIDSNEVTYILTQQRSYYVNSATGDNANDALSSDRAVKTLGQVFKLAGKATGDSDHRPRDNASMKDGDCFVTVYLNGSFTADTITLDGSDGHGKNNVFLYFKKDPAATTAPIIKVDSSQQITIQGQVRVFDNIEIKSPVNVAQYNADGSFNASFRLYDTSKVIVNDADNPAILVNMNAGNVRFSINDTATVTNSGGIGVKVQKCHIEMNGGTIKDCTASGVYVTGSSGKFIMNNGTITGCKGTATTIGTTTVYYGGGVYVENSATFEMKGGDITENTCSYIAAGVYVCKSSKFTMSGGNIISNIANSCGGGVSLATNSTFTMSGGTISGNECTNTDDSKAINGGGIYAVQSTITISGGTISDNTAKIGGGIYAYKGNFSMSGGTISGNTATQNGGALHVSGDGSTILSAYIYGNAVIGDSSKTSAATSTAHSNKAGQGGGICVGKGAEVYIGYKPPATTGGNSVVDNNCNVNIAYNLATSKGGGICVDEGGTLDMVNSTVKYCRAESTSGDSFGGGISNSGTTTISGKTIITGNIVYNSTTKVAKGGGIWVGNNNAVTNLDISGNVVISNNKSTVHDGDINSASDGGGGIFLGNNSFCTIDTTGTDTVKITGNLAHGYGGGIKVWNSLIIKGNCEITGNSTQGKANSGGGGICVDKVASDDKAQGICTFENNASVTMNNSVADGQNGANVLVQSTATFTNNTGATYSGVVEI